MRQGIVLPESTFSADSLTVSVQPPWAIAGTLKIPNTGSHTIVWTRENTAHTDRNGGLEHSPIHPPTHTPTHNDLIRIKWLYIKSEKEEEKKKKTKKKTDLMFCLRNIFLKVSFY